MSTNPAPSPQAVEEAWTRYELALLAFDRSPTSYPARQLLLTALRQLREVDPRFLNHPAVGARREDESCEET